MIQAIQSIDPDTQVAVILLVGVIIGFVYCWVKKISIF